MKFYFIFFILIFQNQIAAQITFVNNWGDNDKITLFLNSAIEKYNRKHKDTIITHYSKEHNEYIRETDFKFLLNTPMISPDLFAPTENILYKFLDPCERLNKQINSKRIFHPVMMGLLENYDNKIFPLEISTYVFFYNKRLFRELNIKIPKNRFLTMDEFVQICLVTRYYSKTKNIDPVVIGIKGDDYWRCSFFIYHIFLRVLGKEKFTLLMESKIPWTDKEILKSLKITNMLFNESAMINKDAADISDIEAQQRFQRKKAAMYFSGSWYLSSEFQPSEIGVIPFFNIIEYPQGKNSLFMNISKSICVYNQSEKKEQAIAFLNSLDDYENNQLWNQEVKTISPFRNQKFYGISNDILYYLNNNDVVNMTPIYYQISKDYYLSLMNLFYNIFLGKKTIQEIEALTQEFHKKVEKNGWYKTN